MATPLPSAYYLSNFIELIDHVTRQYEDLLSVEELAFHRNFRKLKSDAQKLYVRMLMRKGELFRSSRLGYAEIADTEAAAEALAAQGFLAINPRLSLSDLLPLFRRDEWLMIASNNCVQLAADSRKLKRAELEERLLQEFPATSEKVLLPEAIYKIQQGQCFDKYRLLFFANDEQDLTDFILRDLGLCCYEKYRLDHDTRYFQSHKQVEHYQRYFKMREALPEVLLGEQNELLAFLSGLPDQDGLDPILQRRVRRLFYHVARQLERLDCLDDALSLYRQCPLPEGRERTVRVLTKLDHHDAALALCREIIDAPLSEEECVFARQFGQRLAKKNHQPWPREPHYLPPQETWTLPYDDQRVELLVAKQLASQGHCYYVENALHCSLFGLHYWDTLFAPVRGAFTHHFQAAPLDLYSPDFRHRRWPQYQEADRRMDSPAEFAAHIRHTWKIKQGLMSPFVFWRSLDETLIDLALARIPLEHWRAIFKRLWSDLRANRAGFPDLVFFPDDGAYELIEVKGPGDHIQKNQLRWMQYFQQHQIPHRVINVEWK